MPRNRLTGSELECGGSSGRMSPIDIRVTPAMRRKVDDLAVWLAGGDASKVCRATAAVMEMLCEAARVSSPGRRSSAYRRSSGQKTSSDLTNDSR